MLTPKKIQYITLACIGVVIGAITFIWGAYQFIWVIYTPGLLLMCLSLFFLSNVKDNRL